MDGAVIFFFVIAAAALAITFLALRAVSKAPETGDQSLGPVARFQQKLVEINKVPDPKGRGTLWVPDE